MPERYSLRKRTISKRPAPLRTPKPRRASAGQLRELETEVNQLQLTSPLGPKREYRRQAHHLTKHDAFRPSQLALVAQQLQEQVPRGEEDEDRYELMKISDSLKVCGYQLNQPTNELEEIYRLLAWSMHPGAVEAPDLSAKARDSLLRVFGEVGHRIREETDGMAGYHRRHVLRKLLVPKEGGTRRNPLKIPGPIVDIWKDPHSSKKVNNNSSSL